MPTETEAEAVHIVLGEMISNEIKNWDKYYSIAIVSLPGLYLLLPLAFPILLTPKMAKAEPLDFHKHPQSYVIEKLKSYELQPFPEERREREKLIFRTYDSMNVNVQRNL